MVGQNGGKPLSEPDIQALVAAGVENLSSDDVKVVMSPVSPRTGPAAEIKKGGVTHGPKPIAASGFRWAHRRLVALGYRVRVYSI